MINNNKKLISSHDLFPHMNYNDEFIFSQQLIPHMIKNNMINKVFLIEGNQNLRGCARNH